MKRFLVFQGDNYYPNGGWEDFTGWFDTIEEAREKAVDNLRNLRLDDTRWNTWSQIVDTTTWTIVEKDTV